jgi:hypothetical protein
MTRLMPPASPRPKTLINVCGMPRSGTTMLGLMLASGDDAVSSGEACSWFRVARYRPGATIPDFFRSLADVDERVFHQHLMDLHDVDFSIDSSKTFDWVVDQTRYGAETGVRVFNILVWKSPVDIALSWWKRGNYERWRAYYLRYHAQLLLSGVDFCTVPYDALVEAPADTLQAICTASGLPYFEGKERFWEHDHELMGTNSAGVKDQVERRTSEFRKPPVPTAFRPLAREVEQAAQTDTRLQRVIEALAARSVLAPESAPAFPHRYRPHAGSRMAYWLYRTLKVRWVRFRWNVIEPRFGPFGAVA